MKKIFTGEFGLRIIIEVLLLGTVVFLIQEYYKNKWAPQTAAETLKNENFLNAKRDIYFDAISIANRYFEYLPWSGVEIPDSSAGINHGQPKPTETEVNICFSKLCLYSNKAVIDAYLKIFSHKQASSSYEYKIIKYREKHC